MTRPTRMRRRRNLESARSDRWKREDDAVRLKAEVPAISQLRLELFETEEGVEVPASRRVRHIIVDRAAALFEIACSTKDCEHGGHDITDQILPALKNGSVQVDGTHDCKGRIEEIPCIRTLAFTAYAKFGD